MQAFCVVRPNLVAVLSNAPLRGHGATDEPWEYFTSPVVQDPTPLGATGRLAARAVATIPAVPQYLAESEDGSTVPHCASYRGARIRDEHHGGHHTAAGARNRDPRERAQIKMRGPPHGGGSALKSKCGDHHMAAGATKGVALKSKCGDHKDLLRRSDENPRLDTQSQVVFVVFCTSAELHTVLYYYINTLYTLCVFCNEHVIKTRLHNS